MKLLASLLLLLASFHLHGAERSILAIFAHPDDDISAGPALAHYAKQGVKVHLAIVTSGQRGTANTKIPAGDPLAAAREEEARKACQAYGIQPPIFFQEHDGELGTGKFDDRIKKRFTELVEQLQPSVVITWGPEGLTGHSDHIQVGRLVTDVIRDWNGHAPQPRLYWVAWPKSRFEKPVPPFNESAHTVRDELITTIIDCRDGLKEAAEAERCYVTQHPPAIAEQINDIMAKTLEGKVYLRKIEFGKPARETDLF